MVNVRSATGVLAPLRRLRNVGLVVGAALAGLLLPAGEVLSPLVTPLVVVLVYGSFRDLRPSDVGRSTALSLAVALVVAHLLLPVAAAGVGSTFLTGGPLIGVLVIAAAPTTAGSAIIWSRLGSGDVALATVVALVTILLAPVLLPASLTVLLARNAALSPVPVVRELAVIVGGGLALSWALPADRVAESTLGIVSRAAIALLVYVSVASSELGTTSVTTLVAVAAVALAVTGIGLVLSTLTGRVLGYGRPRIRALFFATSLKNLGIALVVAASLGVSGGGVAAITVYYVIQQVASACFVEVTRQ